MTKQWNVRIRVGNGPAGPDETGFLPVHDNEMGICIIEFSPTKTAFILFFRNEILCEMLLKVQNKRQKM